ncbi:MAG: phytanoyl-CoA dioxygenase family protein [Gammaproteobacteria bacterium]|nr:phytanoyl-CoA dioxygenase family protein [Gammaproteobacteria bacterium]
MRDAEIAMDQGRNARPEMRRYIGQLQRDGLTGPFELADQSILDAVSEVAIGLQALQRAQNSLATLAGQELRHTTLINRHMAFGVIGELFRDANLQSVVADCFGKDLVLWQTKFFPKYEGVGENRWHHDRIIENGDDPVRVYDTSNHFSFVVALSDLGIEHGRIEYIRGSHLPIDGFDRDMPRLFDEMPEVVHDRITPLTLRRGEFAVFHSALLHRSLAYGHREEDWRPGYFGAPNPELRRNADIRSGRISLAARLARKGTVIPERYGSNPAGAAHAIAEPIPYYRATVDQDHGNGSVVMPFN